MVCGDYLIKSATDILGGDNGLGVYVFDKHGDVITDLHLCSETNLLDPVDLEFAINWCESHMPSIRYRVSRKEDSEFANISDWEIFRSLDKAKEYFEYLKTEARRIVKIEGSDQLVSLEAIKYTTDDAFDFIDDPNNEDYHCGYYDGKLCESNKRLY